MYGLDAVTDKKTRLNNIFDGRFFYFLDVANIRKTSRTHSVPSTVGRVDEFHEEKKGIVLKLRKPNKANFQIILFLVWKNNCRVIGYKDNHHVEI